MRSARWIFFSEKILLITVILFSFCMGLILGIYFNVLKTNKYIEEDCSVVYNVPEVHQDDTRVPWFFEHDLNDFPIVRKEVNNGRKNTN